MNSVLYYFVVAGVWYVISCAIVGLLSIDFLKSLRSVVRIPMSKKSLAKADPIYRICTSNMGFGLYIEKWTIDWVTDSCLTALARFIPHHITVQRPKYVMAGRVAIGKYKDVTEIKDDLRTLYEYHWRQKEKIKSDHLKKEDEKREKISELNREFDENIF